VSGASQQSASPTSGELRLAAMDLLARREHGSQELESKLRKRFRAREFDGGMLRDVIDQLMVDGLLSDERFAASKARQLAGRGYGPARIRRELAQLSVDHLLSHSMEEAFESEIDWAAQAAAAYQKKYHGQAIEGGWAERQRERGRRLRFLQYRGFDADISQQLVSADDRGDAVE